MYGENDVQQARVGSTLVFYVSSSVKTKKGSGPEGYEDLQAKDLPDDIKNASLQYGWHHFGHIKGFSGILVAGPNKAARIKAANAVVRERPPVCMHSNLEQNSGSSEGAGVGVILVSEDEDTQPTSGPSTSSTAPPVTPARRDEIKRICSKPLRDFQESDPVPVFVLPSALSLCFSGRGSKQTRKISLPKADGFDIASVSCPHGCRLQVKTNIRSSTTVEMHIRRAHESSEPLKISFGRLSTRNPDCPSCGKHMAVALLENDKEIRTENKGHAFVACLWAPDGEDSSPNREKTQRYITDALVLGFSLYQYCPAYDRVLLVTSEVAKLIEIGLLKMYWVVKVVKHVVAHPSRLKAGRAEARFSKVFTKYRCWEQIEYRKVCVLDLDVIVTRGIGEIFENQAPAAVFRGNMSSPAGVCRDSSTLYSKRTGEQQGGINAGVMLIEPSLDDFEYMQGRLNSPGQSTAAPEQDFLSTMFPDRWRKLDVKYNWQPHQLRHVAERGLFDTERQLADDIAVYHFSGDPCPRDFLFKKYIRNNKNLSKSVDMEEFARRLASFLGRNKTSEDDLEKMRMAIMKWYSTFADMWSQLVTTTVGHYTRCPACDEMEQSIEHAFLSCMAVQEYRTTWKRNPDFPLGGQSELDALRFNHDLFPASLHFVACVFHRRHPKGVVLEPVLEAEVNRSASTATSAQSRRGDASGARQKRNIAPTMSSTRRAGHPQQKRIIVPTMSPAKRAKTAQVERDCVDIRAPSQLASRPKVPIKPSHSTTRLESPAAGSGHAQNLIRNRRNFFCPNMKESGTCPYEHCKFCQKMLQRFGTNNANDPTCWDFKRGRCKAGAKCKYQHEI